MIERHYFRDNLIKSFDFSFGFGIPGSTNTWEAVYDMPPLDSQLVDDMIAHPYETESDSFYFVGDKLIMHNKAYYKYVREDSNAQCKSYEAKYAQPSSSKEIKASSSKAQAKGAKGGAEAKHGGAKVGSKAEAKIRDDDDDPWSKESDYY
ncbi:hypothetical protein CTAYLR_000830 [Chrysophaeum taylorii]|uniref:GMP phosphodiesterase delta subunit domain-containing protein n=1 Tax=Chrysophaeum taylorii TaxID=2483200 RepID=A0AAD7UP57_9STRA|nr:hypothetical protein CTAYLR_000830 [Chrysophaeum taylorii]